MAEEDGTLAGRTLGAYRLLDRLHVGATSEIYRAEDAQLGRTVVVKLLKADADEQTTARFVEAARLAASLDHGNVVRVLAYGEVEGRHFLAMPMLAETLRDRLARDGIPPVGETARIVVQAAAGLNAVHIHGFSHGNLTSANILFDEMGRVVLTGFAGPARDGADARANVGYQSVGDGADETPRDAGERPNSAAKAEIAEDVYALGAVLYELLAGVAPVWRIGDDEASSGLVLPSEHNPLVWRELDAVVAQALAADPDARYADARLFAQALRATVMVHLHGRRISAEQPVPEIRAPKAAFDAPGALLPSTAEMRAFRGLRRMDRRMLIVTLALTAALVLACVGSGFAMLSGFRWSSGASGYQWSGAQQQGGPGQIAIVTATATATPLVTPTPLPTATPLVDPLATPGTRPTATVAPATSPSLVFPLRVQFSIQGSACVGSLVVQNNGPTAVSWSGVSGALPAGFRWWVNGASFPGYPTNIDVSPGASVTVNMKAKCWTPPQTYPIAVKDSQGFSHTISFEMLY